jgi:hypothetical protein
MNSLANKIEVIAERDGKTSSWVRVGGTGFMSLKSNLFMKHRK